MDEPFFNVPKDLGRYADLDHQVGSISIQKEPEVVRTFVRGMVKALGVRSRQPGRVELPRQEAVLHHGARRPARATLNRSFADDQWSPDGIDHPAILGYGKGGRARRLGFRQVDISSQYEIIEMRFVESGG